MSENHIPLDENTPETVALTGPLYVDDDGNSIVVSTPDPLEIVAGDGTLLFRITNSGTVELPDPERVEEAAAIFWREVIKLALIYGYTVSFISMKGEK